ncbi:uncharacterized protein LOC113750625 [Coffea eugenioides]|uniref:uncharacterized protein LOC113750625 n=1 Tax=Coffea eugenioides TaxID=49369 RepID=UPI000F606EDC|nr:uncharacterized protein LOC113750625 [Coffea eugenioides]
MATGPSFTGEGIPPIAAQKIGVPSFADVVSSRTAVEFQSKSFASLSSSSSGPRVQGVVSSHRGEPSVSFSMEDIERIAAPFQYALVGKFSRGRPIMDDLRKFFHALDLTAKFSLGLLDRRHILIRLSNEADYYRVWSRGFWSINKAPMRVFKWSIDFHVDREDSIVPVWFALPMLPVHLFHKECLFSIVGCLGRPLCVDAATAKGSRPNVARVCVEVDLLKTLPSRVWIAFGERMGFWQPLIPENLPKYCEHCFHQGHVVAECRIKNPGLKIETSRGDGVSRPSQANAGTSDVPPGAATQQQRIQKRRWTS